MTDKIEIVAGGKELLGQIEDLWRQLNSHHLQNSLYFKEKYMELTFEGRRKSLEEKADHGEILVLLVRDRELDRNVGYCVSSVTRDGIGEVDSILVEAEYRKLGLGDVLMQKTLNWIEDKNPREIMLNVAGGNEKAVHFYKKYGFQTHTTKLVKVDAEISRNMMPNTDYIISSDKSLINLDTVEALLSGSYWAADRSREKIKTSIENSMCFGVYDGARQIAFARVITDYTLFAYLCDVIVDEEYRGKSVGKKLMNYIISCDELKEVRSWTLKTKDAHGLYQQYGFEKPSNPDLYMQRILK